MYTKFDGMEYRPHGLEFVFVYNVLVSMAIKQHLLPGDLTARERRGKADPADDVIIKMLKS
ncbi:MAG: hypothetical protein K5864_09860 [Bacteroidales bacterium]|nr:hypothetical protein [Bacteroidales bacterium]